MALATYPAIASPVKSVQRGSAAGAGTVTITAVDISKSFVNIFGTTSSGTVAASGSIGAVNGTASAAGISVGNARGMRRQNYNNASYGNSGTIETLNLAAQNIGLNAASLTGGTTNLVAAVVQGYLSNSTSLVVSGACRYEVVEFN